MDNIKISSKISGENNRQYAYRILHENIMTFTLQPGTVINEAFLCEILGISRTPIREALLKLKEEYLLEVYPQRSSQVSLIDIPLMNEGVLMRSLIEPQIYQQLIGNVNNDIIRQFQENLKQQKQAVLEGKTHTFFILDDQFHDIIYDAARKKNIKNSCHMITSQFDRIRYLVTLEGHMNIHDVYTQHQELYTHLITGAWEGNEQLYQNHLVGYEKFLTRITTAYPHYFKNHDLLKGNGEIL